MKRIWFTQQNPFNHIPLRLGLGLITEEQAENEWDLLDATDKINYRPVPKRYTTRTRSLTGEYYVVEGSRYKAKPVDPEIKFKVSDKIIQLDLKTGIVTFDGRNPTNYELTRFSFNKMYYRFPELDLGLSGATFDQLKSELLKLNKSATESTPFYVNLLEPL